MVNKESLQSINSFVSLLEEFILNLNELHTSSEKVWNGYETCYNNINIHNVNRLYLILTIKSHHWFINMLN